MANLYKPRQPQFRHISLIENLTETQLEEQGYYIGSPCPHGHVIRDTENHWCYFCVKKILSNVCGFDVNYLHKDYKVKYAELWRRVSVGSQNECWIIGDSGHRSPKRICMPSYRSFYSKVKSENVNIHKALYQCAWGDIGSLLVTRTCGNPSCGNPLHMTSSWNRAYPPAGVVPFEIDFKAEKLMLYNRQLATKQQPEKIIEQSFKQAIRSPFIAVEAPEYDEG